jgi:hypothetical protein
MKKQIYLVILFFIITMNLWAQNSRFQYNGLNGNSKIIDFERVMVNLNLERIDSQDPFHRYIAYGGTGGSIHFIIRGEFDERDNLINILIFYVYSSSNINTIFSAYTRIKMSIIKENGQYSRCVLDEFLNRHNIDINTFQQIYERTYENNNLSISTLWSEEGIDNELIMLELRPDQNITVSYKFR